MWSREHEGAPVPLGDLSDGVVVREPVILGAAGPQSRTAEVQPVLQTDHGRNRPVAA